MHGCVFQAGTGLVSLLLLAGCGDARPQAGVPPPNPPAAPSRFDPATAGTISGTVIWDGDFPAADPWPMRAMPAVAPGKSCPNPNLPVVDRKTRGVGNAVIFLRGVAADKARPWDHPAARVEMRELDLHVCQGATVSRVGFVRRGEAVDFVSRDALFHALEVRGASFFSLRFVERDQLTSRRFPDQGVVELKSAAGYPWMRAYLLVDDHPYFARTDSQGRFHLSQVPPGKCQVVCWMPNWHVTRQDRDPESSLITRVTFAAPLEVEKTVELERKGVREVNFIVSSKSLSREQGPAAIASWKTMSHGLRKKTSLGGFARTASCVHEVVSKDAGSAKPPSERRPRNS